MGGSSPADPDESHFNTRSKNGEATFPWGSCMSKCPGRSREPAFLGRLNCLAFARADIIKAEVGMGASDELGKQA